MKLETIPFVDNSNNKEQEWLGLQGMFDVISELRTLAHNRPSVGSKESGQRAERREERGKEGMADSSDSWLSRKSIA